MTESKEEAEKRALRELEGKNIAHYSILLGAWIQTKMERDKTLVTLSAAAIGLLVTILTTVGVNSIWEIPIFAVAVISFLTTIWSSLVIYQLNSQHLEDAIRGSSERDPRLEKYDKRSIRAFIIGSFTALIIGILSASVQLAKSEENTMAEKEDSSKITGSKTIKESVNGITNLNPNATVKKSLDGITNLNPQATEKPVQSQDQGQSSSSNQGNSGDSSSGGKKE
ncbi:MAG TPA: hypothetical protein ENJ28_09480 [Gammaproteobacteria bacterium]|nr:hypothetical protein [Gammaproteobacteria bacterium]